MLCGLQMCCCFANAQTADTSAMKSLKNKILAADSASFAQYEFAKGKAFFTSGMPDGFNTLSIGQEFSKGGYMPLQSSNKIRNTYMLTEGKSTLGDVALWGSFAYHRISEDSTRWAHQTRNNPTAPYYFGSVAKVNYERSVYQFNATAERNMLRQNLPFAIGINYRIGDHYSTNDPRGTVKDYQLNVQGSLGYYLSKRLKAGLGIKYGYGEESTDVAYKNKDNISNQSRADYITQVINGYNVEDDKIDHLEFRNDQSRFGFEGYLSYQSNDFGKFELNASYLKEEQKFVSKYVDVLKGRQLNDYHLSTYNFDLIWQKKIQKNQLIILLNYRNMDGRDFNYFVKSNNYLYNSNDWSAKAILSTKGKTAFNYILELSKNGEERQDGLRGIIIGYNRLKTRAGIGFSRPLNGNQSWGLHVNGIYSMSLDDQFVVPAVNVQRFTTLVVYHDYLYNTSGFFGGSFSADYNFPTYKQIQTGIKLGFSYMDALKFKSLDRPVSAIPGNNRFVTNLSINFYF